MNVDTRLLVGDSPARRLTRSKRPQRIVFSGSAFYYIDDKGEYKVMSGLLPVLKSTFWPDTSFGDVYKTKRTNELPTRGKKTTTVKRERAAKPQGSRGKGRFFGTIRGTQIHLEMEDFINMDEVQFEKKHRKLHPWTKRLLLYFTETRNWRPLCAEFPVFDEDLRIASRFDMVLEDRVSHRLVFIELKTGHSGCFQNHIGYMQGELSFMRNSPLNWANIQLTFCMMLLLRHHTDLSLKHCLSFVIRIDEDSLDCYELDNQFISQMYPSLLESVRDYHKNKKNENNNRTGSVK